MEWNNNSILFRLVCITCSVIFAFGLSACQSLQLDFLPAMSNTLLFQDNFQDPDSGWDRTSTARGETQYVDGEYRIWIDQSYTNLWVTPHLDFDDVQIEVQVENVDGPNSNIFGVICRVNRAEESYYFFVISSDGYYGIGKVRGQKQVLLSHPYLMPHPAIRQGPGLNQIRADCVDDQLEFYANGQKLDEVHDNEFVQGDIGLTAGTFDQPGVDIRFDDITVVRP